MDVMYEALQRHFSGIEFRERNAGQQIDEHMRDEGMRLIFCLHLFEFHTSSLNSFV